MNQSFPPLTFLKTAWRVKIDLEVPNLAGCFDLPGLKALVQTQLEKDNKATAVSLVVVREGCLFEMLIKVVVDVWVTSSHPDNQPAGLAFSVRMSGLAPVRGYPDHELFIVAQEFRFGASEPMYMPINVMRCIGDCANALRTSVGVKTRKPQTMP